MNKSWCGATLLALLTSGLLLAVSQPALSQDSRGGTVKGSGVPGEKTVSLPAATRKLRLGVPGTVTVRVDPKAKPQARIRVDRNLLELVAVKSAGDRVTIEAAGSFSTSRELQVEVLLNGLNAMDTTGSADVSVDRVNEPGFALTVSGAGTIRVGSGRVKQLDIKIDGSGDLEASGLVAATCTINSAGAGSADLHCSDSISGEVSGAGELTVRGMPKRRSVRANGAVDIQYVK